MIKTKVEVYDPEKKINKVSLLVENNEVVVAIIDLNGAAKREQPDLFSYGDYKNSIYLGNTCVTFYNLPFKCGVINGTTARYTLTVTITNDDINQRLIDPNYQLYQKEYKYV